MANPWTLFKQLLPESKKWIGQIEGIDNTTGRVTVSVPEGLVSDIIVGGGENYSQGDYVFIKDGIITAKAPDLKSVTNEEVS